MTQTRGPRVSDGAATTIANALWGTLQSVNEADSNLEPANVVDAIVKAGRIVAGRDGQLVKALCLLAASTVYGARPDYDGQEVVSLASLFLGFCEER